jgi:hypothetical protein
MIVSMKANPGRTCGLISRRWSFAVQRKTASSNDLDALSR